MMSRLSSLPDFGGSPWLTLAITRPLSVIARDQTLLEAALVNGSVGPSRSAADANHHSRLVPPRPENVPVIRGVERRMLLG